MFDCSEGAVTLAGHKRLLEEVTTGRGEEVLLYNTGTGLKYICPFAQRHAMRRSTLFCVPREAKGRAGVAQPGRENVCPVSVRLVSERARDRYLRLQAESPPPAL